MCCFFSTYTSSAESLSDVAKRAVPNHPSIIAQKQLLGAAKIGIKEAKAGFLPSVDMRLGGSRARTNSSTTRGRATRPTDRSSQSKVLTRKEGSLTVSQMIFDGFATKNLVGAASSRFELANEQILEIAQGVSLRLSSAYVGVARDRRLLSLAEKNIERHADIINQIQIQVDSGGATAADLDQARARIEGAKAIYMQMGGRLRDSEAAFIEAVGSMPGNIIFPQPDDAIFGLETSNDNNSSKNTTESLEQSSLEYQQALEKVLTIAMENNHSLNSARLTIDSVNSARKAAKSPFLPRVDLQLLGSRTQNVGGSPGMSSDHVATFNFTYNFYRGGGDTARLQSSKLSLAESRARFLEAKRLIQQTLRISFNAWNTARTQLPSLESRVEASQGALDSYKEQFSLGKRTLLDVLNAENEVFGARSALAEGRSTVLLAQFQVLAAMGTLTNYLGVEIFDHSEKKTFKTKKEEINKLKKEVKLNKSQNAKRLVKENKITKTDIHKKKIAIKDIKKSNQSPLGSVNKETIQRKIINDKKKISSLTLNRKQNLNNEPNKIIMNEQQNKSNKIKENQTINEKNKLVSKVDTMSMPLSNNKIAATLSTRKKYSLFNQMDFSVKSKPQVSPKLIDQVLSPTNLYYEKKSIPINLIEKNEEFSVVSIKPELKNNKKLNSKPINDRKEIQIAPKKSEKNINKKNESIVNRVAVTLDNKPKSKNTFETTQSKLEKNNNISNLVPIKIKKPPVFLPGDPS